MNMETKREIHATWANQIHRSSSDHSVTIVDVSDEEMPVSTGFLIRIEKHLFVGTAGHVLRADPNGRNILLGAVPRKLGSVLPPYVNSARIDSNGIDVGFLELHHSVPLLLGKDPLTVDAIADVDPVNVGVFTTVVGYPAEYVPPPLQVNELVASLTAISLQPIGVSDWNTIIVPDGSPPADPRKHIFLDYAEGDPRRLDTGEKTRFPHPGGMSGGAYFDWGHPAKGVLWNVSPKIIAIQSTHYDAKGPPYLRGSRIIHWLRLVAEHYPHLYSEIRQRFPNL